MKVAILTSDRRHPVVPQLERWRDEQRDLGHEVALYFDKRELPESGGDVLFLVSCGQLLTPADRAPFGAVMVLHASDLPRERGWSPHIWAIVGGRNEITVCLLEASDPVDSGDIWLRTSFSLEGHELLAEINQKLFEAELALMGEALRRFGKITPISQQADGASYVHKRTPEHSRLDPDRTISEQFDLLRVVDNARYPAFFDYRGKRYKLTIEKIEP